MNQILKRVAFEAVTLCTDRRSIFDTGTYSITSVVNGRHLGIDTANTCCLLVARFPADGWLPFPADPLLPQGVSDAILRRRRSRGHGKRLLHRISLFGVPCKMARNPKLSILSQPIHIYISMYICRGCIISDHDEIELAPKKIQPAQNQVLRPILGGQSL